MLTKLEIDPEANCTDCGRNDIALNGDGICFQCYAFRQSSSERQRVAKRNTEAYERSMAIVNDWAALQRNRT